jgi:hypothetical protein
MMIDCRNMNLYFLLFSYLFLSYFRVSAEPMNLQKKLNPSLIQQGFYSSVSYSLISPSFEVDVLKSQNQESLGLTVAGGYLYAPQEGWGVATGVGVFQNSKTEKSLPDFLAFRPFTQVIFGLNSQFFVSAGIFMLKWQDEKYQNFISYVGSEYQVGYKVNSRLNLKFGFSFIRIFGEFIENEKLKPSFVSIKGIESQFLYLF